tara:strand:- start:7090 stop:7353 length:264 start_codon:yes stop_codon:yes gene_type:complete
MKKKQYNPNSLESNYEEIYKAGKQMKALTPKMRKQYASFKKEQKSRELERKKESKRTTSQSLINCMKKAKTNKDRKRCKVNFALKIK